MYLTLHLFHGKEELSDNPIGGTNTRNDTDLIFEVTSAVKENLNKLTSENITSSKLLTIKTKIKE